ncbi:BTAD domain-containing putative transcriptional regulator [Rugosimonospora africana]|uniref:SARP family transcriptional regulator n=1 Tax=Rugosimonospora africana TaxID=556532 RepID=A0A8J3QTB4_9ACTN|nr:BTAD domain-containing putative transcriptional regulator [Rugosimonospora africana]GIH15248.1 SARP family transcriptional regulator [Rugosimonospora africana]
MTIPSTGELLRQHRFRAGLTQEDLARRAQVSIRALRYIEQGRVTRPHASSLRRLAVALGLTGDDLAALLGLPAPAGPAPAVPAPAVPAPAVPAPAVPAPAVPAPAKTTPTGTVPAAAVDTGAGTDTNHDPGGQTSREPGRDRDRVPTAASPPHDPGPDAGLRVRILGPLSASLDGRPAGIESAMLRGLLGVLALQQGRTVPVTEIIDVLWGDEPPRTCRQLVHGYVAALRRLLEPERKRRAPATRLRRTAGGYRIELSRDELDLAAVDDFLARARRARRAGDPDTAREALAAAWIRWRDPVLVDAGPRLREHPAAVALAAKRVSIALDHADLALAQGRCAEAAGPLRVIAADEPLHEGVAARLMVALAGCGQQAAALELFETVRARLDAELGVEPGRELREAHLRVLRGHVPAATSPDAAMPDATSPDATSPGAAPAVAVPDAVPAAPVPAVPVAPAQLPPDVAGFTGRDGYLRQLDELLPGGGAAGTVVISTIDGMGGVGKTALAVHWAHRVRDRFPDGQLYVNLHGYAPGPVRPIDALTGFLVALGVPADDVPDDLDQAAALYRSRLAGRRVLVLLDNAARSDQVRPLLPGTTGSLALVTSRHHLPGLIARDGARQFTLDALAPDEAVALLRRMLGESRVDAEPAATARLAGLCAYLPLALRIVAANLIARPRHRIADHVARLEAGNRLAGLAVDGDDDTAVRAAFDLSYAALPEPQQRMFRCLGLVPGPDVTPGAAAALAGTSPVEAGALLSRLADRHLADEHTPGRYAVHDLLRLYAGELADRQDGADRRRCALARLAEHYLDRAVPAARLLYPHVLYLPCTLSRSSDPDPFSGAEEALSWLDAERRNLVATVVQLGRHDHRRAAWQLADALQGFFRVRTATADWQVVNDAALAAAEAEADPAAQAAAHLGLGTLHDFHTRFDEAARHYTRSAALAREAGWTHCHAVALNNLARIHWVDGRPLDTIDLLTQALTLHRQAGRVAGEAVTLANLGVAHGEVARAAAGTGERVGHLRHAAGYLTRALDLHRAIGDRRNEADTLRILAATRRDAGEHAEALPLAERALRLAQETGDARFEAIAWSTIGTVRARLGAAEDALNCHDRALGAAREIGDRQLEAQTLVDLAGTLALLGRPERAARRAREALDIAAGIGSRPLERQARASLDAIAGSADSTDPATAARADPASRPAPAPHGHPVHHPDPGTHTGGNRSAEHRLARPRVRHDRKSLGRYVVRPAER